MKFFLFIMLYCLVYTNTLGQKVNVHLPVNPDASQEAKDLLNYLYQISGKKTLSGMHNVIGAMSKKSDRIYNLTGKYPAVWGGDFGFADSTHDIDNINYRPLLVPEIKKQHHNGSIIVISYHQANPFLGEPTPFKGGIISKLTDEQWKELLTPGTPLYEKWRKQMDLLAFHLILLRDAKIPVIFRPYHEMNGDWFWWGGRKGKDGFIALWNQLYKYYTNHHQLNNLLWAWTPDKPKPGVEDFFPDSHTIDILGCDIYPQKDNPEVYPQEWYDRMHRLANGKPLALTENSVLVHPELLKKQPWVWFMSWGDMVFNTNSDSEIKKTYRSKKVITRDELPENLHK
jgi:mannan endo-1,4-beta-mannosidase